MQCLLAQLCPALLWDCSPRINEARAFGSRRVGLLQKPLSLLASSAGPYAVWAIAKRLGASSERCPGRSSPTSTVSRD
jgi:hypothetical protein